MRRKKRDLFTDKLSDFENAKDELILALETLRVDQELIDIIIGWGSDFTDEETCNLLKDWNNKCPKTR